MANSDVALFCLFLCSLSQTPEKSFPSLLFIIYAAFNQAQLFFATKLCLYTVPSHSPFPYIVK